jgi:uncharacterized surface protein with fasciclin (FAS1) repeats
MKLNYFKISVRKVTLSLGLVLAALGYNAQTNVFDNVISQSPNHTYLTAAINQQGLASALQDPNATLTVFAPTNDAFDQLAAALGTDIAGILALPNLTDVLLYHVANATVPSNALTNGQLVQPLFAGNTIKMTVGTGGVFANHATVTTPDLTADNGVVHVLNKVILSNQTVVDAILANGLTTLATAAIQQQLLPVLTDPFATLTVFGPSNDAFTAVATALNVQVTDLLALPNLTDILTYHVLGTTVASSAVTNGAIVQPVSNTNTLKLTKMTNGDVFVNQAQVTEADINTGNGVLHVLNGVVLPYETVADKAIDGGFTTLVTAVIQERLLPALTNPFSTLTVFAPTNNAFDDLADALNTDINGLLALPTLGEVLKYHVLGTEVSSAAVSNGAIVSPLSTLNTLKLTKTTTGDVFVNHAQVTTADVEADNGVVHVLDKVVLPSQTVVDRAIQAGFTYLTAAVIQERLLPALTDPFATLTVFAPNNEAFEDLADALDTDINGLLAFPLLAEILKYHVLGTEVASAAVTNGAVVAPLSVLNTLKLTKKANGDVFVNQAEVIAADVAADNGVVHVLNAVVLPFETVVDVAIDNGFTSLTQAVVKAELLPALTDPFGTFTVFAPTNTAFNNLATALGTDLNGVLALPNLADVLLYHVVDGIVMSTDLVAGSVEMLNGDNAIVSLTGGVRINNANVTLPDVEADNGVVHVIDAVLIPGTASLTEKGVEMLVAYPNPATDILTVKGVATGNFEIVDMMGAVLSNGTFSDTINVGNLSTGNYVLKISSDNQIFQGRFVKQ